MELKTPPESPEPTSQNKPMFISAIIGLILATFTIVGIPFTIAGLAHVLKFRKENETLASTGESRATALRAAQAENRQLRSDFDRINGMEVLERQDEVARLDENIDALRRHIVTTQDEAKFESDRVADLKQQVIDLEDMVDLNDYGLYNFENPASDSVQYGADLQATRERIKGMVRDKNATSAAQGWTVNGSEAQGRKMVNDMTKLLLRAFNAEAENSIKTVKAGHLSAAKKRLEKSAEAVARLGKTMSIRITPGYLNLREKELTLTHAHLEATKAAKEEEREARAREREERQAQKEFLAAKAKQEKEVEHYKSVLATLQASGDQEAINKANSALAEAEEKLADVESTMANTRAGYVYVISNRGAFGPGIIKIGMTRRLNPDDRVRELGDASVPFYFDSHTMIFAKDAVGLERALHEHFANKRVNLVNLRREYFYATPSEVKEALLEHHADHEAQLLEFHESSNAPEFEASEEMRQAGRIPQAIA
ncbi:chromosome segregation ATPase [Citricoccus zhacaiensis]|uniref:Chromosome segregation ATPase n=1 Tax=Citricoccus zhacaiensis TaxID=489142 RepID=A0ABQ2LV49_9MICC|nr:DUF4041 domain-containing protein [Citricoccus zhacaiensis]GGO43455.1 chromosome segregation ATPase [Citricoccus zhacaiensis]